MRLAKLPQTVIAYDNFNFLDRVRDQVLGSSQPVMRNLTTAILVYHPELVFGFAGTALSFRREMLKCLIALGHKGRLCCVAYPT